MENLFRLLEIEPTKDLEVIKKAYKGPPRSIIQIKAGM